MFAGGGKKGKKNWWLVPGSNQRPVDYDSNALPTELTSQQFTIYTRILKMQVEIRKKNGKIFRVPGSGSRHLWILNMQLANLSLL